MLFKGCLLAGSSIFKTQVGDLELRDLLLIVEFIRGHVTFLLLLLLADSSVFDSSRNVGAYAFCSRSLRALGLSLVVF